MKKHLIVFVVITIFIVWLFLILDNELSKSNNVSLTLKQQQEEFPVVDKNYFDIKYNLDSNPCFEFHKIIIIVTCYVGHVELRSAHRRALPSHMLENIGIKRVFLLASIPEFDKKYISQNSIIDESNRFGDLVQGDFLEAYRNLTLKHVMGLKWAYTHCPSADFIIKVDDDIIFNIASIVDYINKCKNDDDGNFLLGYTMRGMKPIRNLANKWFVTKSEYHKSFYPPFLSGWMYTTTPHTAKQLVSQAMITPYFWIDDVYVTGIVASKLGIRLKDIKSDNIYLEYSELMDCCITDMIKKNITCEYSVAPNGGDNNRFVKFVSALRDCSMKHCAMRSAEKALQKTCVTFKNNLPLDKGKPVVNIFKL